MSDKVESEMCENFADMLAQSEIGSQNLAPGGKVTGVIIEIGADEVFLDLGLKEDGIMDRKDLLDARGEMTAGLGDRVEAYVVNVSSQGVRVSRSMAGSGIGALEEARDSGIPVEGRVKGACKGGYQVTVLGRTAFCPGSQMDIPAGGEDPAGLVFDFLVTRVENHGRNIVVSRRALRDKQKEESLDRLLESINLNDIVEGTVSRLTPYGVFIELAPAIEGMAHISELGWARVGAPEEVLSPGDRVRAKIISLDTADRKKIRIGLSLKQAMGDPWDDVEKRWKAGDTVEGTVSRLAPFGAFVEIAPGIEGLVHLSDMAWGKRVNRAEDILAQGQKIPVKIREINIPARRIALSVREAAGDPWFSLDFAAGDVVKGSVDAVNQHGVFVNLAPAITGLIPASVVKSSSKANALAKLQKGDELEVVIDSVDHAAHRISLLPKDETYEERQAEKTWREHSSGSKDEPSSGIMAQALKKAFQKKGDTRG